MFSNLPVASGYIGDSAAATSRVWWGMMIPWILFLGLLLIVNLAHPRVQRKYAAKDAEITGLRREVARLLDFPDAKLTIRELEGRVLELRDELEDARKVTIGVQEETKADPCAEQKRLATLAFAEAMRARQRERQSQSDLNQIFDVALQVGNAIGPIQSNPAPRPTAGDIVDALWILPVIWSENLQLRKSVASIPKDMKDLLGVGIQLEDLNSQARKATMKLFEKFDHSSKGPTVAEFIESSTAEIERLRKLIYDKHGTPEGQQIFEQLKRQLDNVQNENIILHDEVQALRYTNGARKWYPKPPHDPPTEDIEMVMGDLEYGDLEKEKPSSSFSHLSDEMIRGSSAFNNDESPPINTQTPLVGTDIGTSGQPKKWFEKSVFNQSTHQLYPR